MARQSRKLWTDARNVQLADLWSQQKTRADLVRILSADGPPVTEKQVVAQVAKLRRKGIIVDGATDSRTPRRSVKPPKLPLTLPGVYQGIANSAYHGMLCSTPSLSASGSVVIEKKNAKIFWHGSYLNRGKVRKESREFDMGSAAHYAILEPDILAERVMVINAPNYQSGRAQAGRAHARSLGRVPLLGHQFETIQSMRAAIKAHPFASQAFIGGIAEQTLAWRDPKTGIWLKCRPDYALLDWSEVSDLKTTYNVHPEALIYKGWQDGWYMRAAWYLDGIHKVTGIRPQVFWFVCIEVEPPHCITVVYYELEALDFGAECNRRSIDIFDRGLSEGYWPEYAEKPEVLRLPFKAEGQLDQRKAAGDFRVGPTPELFRKAMKFQEPVMRG